MNEIRCFNSYYDADQSTYITGKYHGKEDAYVDTVKLCGTLHNHIPRRACITFRIPVSKISVNILFYRMFLNKYNRKCRMIPHKKINQRSKIKPTFR